jgi:hypothetical protein
LCFAKFANPSGEIGNPINPQASTAPENHNTEKPTQRSSLSTNDQLGIQTIEADDEEGEGWDNEESDPFDFSQQAEDSSDAWGKIIMSPFFCFSQKLT